MTEAQQMQEVAVVARLVVPVVASKAGIVEEEEEAQMVAGELQSVFGLEVSALVVEEADTAYVMGRVTAVALVETVEGSQQEIRPDFAMARTVAETSVLVQSCLTQTTEREAAMWQMDSQARQQVVVVVTVMAAAG